MKIKKFSKVLLSLLLVLSISFSSTLVSFAATNSSGGTWKITTFKTDKSLAETGTDLPIKVTYLPYSQVKAFHDADLDTSGLSKYLKTYGKKALTLAIAKEIGKKYAVNFTGLVGLGFLLSDLQRLAVSDNFNKGINTAYAAKKGMVYTIYEASWTGTIFARCTNWTDGKTMPTYIYFKNISGYAKGTISVGTYDLRVDW